MKLNAPKKQKVVAERRPRPTMVRFPSVNVGSYIKLIGQMGASQRATCGYCGFVVPAIGDKWVCPHCELAIESTALTVMLNDKERIALLSDISNRMNSNDYVGVIADYDKIIARYGTPEFLYNSGLAYMQYSNFEVESIRYDRMGFMEENSVHRKNGSALASKAKLMFNRAYAYCQKNSGTAADAGGFLTFTWFMSAIKLGRLRNAAQIRDMLQSSGNAYLTAYAEMVINAEQGKYAETAIAAEKLLGKDMFSANAVYYLAWALFKHGRNSDSLKIITALGKQLQNNNIISLTAEIQRSLRPDPLA